MSDQPIPAIPQVAENVPYRFQFSLFALKGRLIRQHFWISYLILIATGCVIGLIPVLNLVGGIAILWGKLAINTKRLHDMGHSGWFAAIPLVTGALATLSILIAATIIFYAFLVGFDIEAINPDTAGVAIGLLILSSLGLKLVNLAFLLWLGLTNTQPTANKYGPNPKQA